MEDDAKLDRLGGWAALAAALFAVTYTIGFKVLQGQTLGAQLAAFSLMAGGLVSAVALFAVYGRLKSIDPSLAMLGVALGFAGVMGAFIHGSFDLANVIHPEQAGTAGPGPFPVDPRGLLTFGVSGLGLATLSWVALRATSFPRWLSQLGVALGVVLVIVYLSRLIVFDAGSVLVLGPAVVAAVMGIVWYGALGMKLLGRM